ncbi:MAG: hypothetical protein NVV79_08370 [Devosia ginsengisoli]|nr:hypothetical protein [Devosia ginsengisoli]MCR6671350.1 hypothetical protein [Devosia ginsengisoli]
MRQRAAILAALLVRECHIILGHDPVGLALEYGQRRGHLGAFVDHLHSGGAGADHANTLARQVQPFRPAGGMHHRQVAHGALRPLRHEGTIEKTQSADDDVEALFGTIFEAKGVDLFGIAPRHRPDRGAEAEMPAHVERIGDVVEIAQQLALQGMAARPVIGTIGEGIEVRGRIDLGAGIAVVIPGAAQARRFLEHDNVAEAIATQFDDSRKAAEATADDRNADTLPLHVAPLVGCAAPQQTHPGLIAQTMSNLQLA